MHFWLIATFLHQLFGWSICWCQSLLIVDATVECPPKNRKEIPPQQKCGSSRIIYIIHIYGFSSILSIHSIFCFECAWRDEQVIFIESISNILSPGRSYMDYRITCKVLTGKIKIFTFPLSFQSNRRNGGGCDVETHLDSFTDVPHSVVNINETV